MASISENLKKIQDRISEAALKSGRSADAVRLVAVSKFHSAEEVSQAITAGQILFGENRVQEAALKFDELRAKGLRPDLHIIGSLQRNKVKEAVRIASMIESVDRISLMEEIEKQCAKVDKTIEILLEVHTAEESKSGFESFEELKRACAFLEGGLFPHVKVRGLMTMAPFTDDTDAIRASFKTVKNYQSVLAADFPALDFSILSMGMSADFEIAIEEGSTLVRIGTAIFGERNYSK